MKVIWSLTAERNLNAIWDYIAQDNIDAAERMIERLRSSANILTNHPLMGRAGRARNTRELTVAGTPYILIYRPSRERIDIARVLHGAQDYPPKG